MYVLVQCYLQFLSETLALESPGRDTGQLLDWECGRRKKATWKKMLDRLTPWDVQVYCTNKGPSMRPSDLKRGWSRAKRPPMASKGSCTDWAWWRQEKLDAVLHGALPLSLRDSVFELRPELFP